MISKVTSQHFELIARVCLVCLLLVSSAFVFWLFSQGGSNELMVAVSNGDLETVREVLEKQPDLINQRLMSRSPLHVAVIKRDAGMARLLIQYGAKIDARDEAGNTSLIIAAIHMDVEMAKLLVDSGADPKIQDHHGNTVFHHLAYGGYGREGKKFAQFMKASGSNPKIRNQYGYQSWQIAELNRKKWFARFLKRQASTFQKAENQS
jgi:ankyrin repeat protein